MKDTKKPVAKTSGAKPDIRLKPVLKLAEACQYEVGHTHHVMKLSLELFDHLSPLHNLGETERFYLQSAALLHDIGWIEGRKGHHKASLRRIIESSELPFDEREKLIVGSIARYHRRSLPKEMHEHYAALDETGRRTVSMLAGILRIADGLDRSHKSLVKSVQCQVTDHTVQLNCIVNGPATDEREFALEKGDLFEMVFERKLEIEC